MTRIMKGMKIQGDASGSPDRAPARQGGVAPKGSIKGGGPNGESGLSNSAAQETAALLRNATKLKKRIAKEKEEGGSDVHTLRRRNSIQRF